MFQSQDGLFQFVFANEDTYFTESGLRISLRRWLFRALRDRYQTVFFVDDQKEGFSVLVFDQVSWDAVAAQNKKLLPFSLKGNAAYRSAKGGCSVSVSSDTVLRLLQHAGRSAFVFGADAFAILLEGKEELLYQLFQEHDRTENLILIQCSASAEKNRPFFRESNGVFSSKTENGYLFPEVVQAFQETDELREGCYRQLKRLLGENCVFLNCFTREAVGNVVRNAMWHTDCQLWDMDQSALESVADFVYLWHHSDFLQARWSTLFSPNYRHEFRRLYTDLTKNWDAVVQASAEYNSMNFAGGQASENVEEPYCICDDQLVRRLRTIRVQDGLGSFDGPAIWTELQKAVRLLQTERISSPDAELHKLLLRVIVRMEKAAQRGDLRTVRYAGECLQFACEENYSMEERAAVCLRGYDLLTETSETLCSAESGSKQTEQDLGRIQAEFSSLMGELEGGSAGLGALLYKAKVDRAENLQTKVELVKGLVRSDTERVSTLHQMVIKLETMIREVKQMKGVNSESAEIIRQLSAQLKQDPGQQLRDLMNTWI